MHDSLAGHPLVAASLIALLGACSTGPSGSGPGSGGSSGSGGSTRTGGAPGTGGAGPTGGAIGTGGTSSTGGAAGSGGTTSSGGATSTGGIKGTGGTTSAGGATGSGGATSTGGGSGSGGRIGTGGATSTGGVSGTGGATITGGVSGTGGATITGGTSGKGGSSGTGGATGTGGTSGKGGSTGTGGATGAGGSTHAGTWRIMPLGDSITMTTCYPQFLFQELTNRGRTNFVFVGRSQANQICGTGVPNTVCDGHSGTWVTNLMSGGSEASLLPGFTGNGSTGNNADVVLMHFGTNDISGTQPTQKILDAYSQVVDALRAAVPTVIVFVAQIIPMNPTNCPTCESRLEDLNSAIPAWATGKSTPSSPVYPVDLWSAIPVASYMPNSPNTDDGVHPKAPAAQVMADSWYAALVAKGIP